MPAASVTSRLGSAPTAIAAGASLSCLIYDTSAPAADPKRVVALGVAIVAVALRLRHLRNHSLRVHAALLAWISFVTWSAISVLWGRESGWVELAPWTAATGLALAVLSLPRRDALRCAIDAAVVTGGLSSLAALYELASGARGILVHGGQGNGNWLGLLLAWTIPLSVHRTWYALKSRDRYAAVPLALLVMQFVAIVACESRTAWLALLAGAGVALAIRARQWMPAWTAAVVMCVLVIPSSPARGAPEADEPVVSAPAISDAWQGRLRIWRGSLEAAEKALPTGCGLGGFGHAYLSAQGRRLVSQSPAQAARSFENAATAHNDWIQVVVESGPLALLLLGAAIAAGVGGMARAGSAAGAASLTGLAVCAIGDSPLRQPAIVVLLGLLLGALPRNRSLGRRGVVLGLLVAGACGWHLSQGVAQWVADRWETEAGNASPAHQLRLLERAVRTASWSGSAWLALGLARLDRGDCEGAVEALDRSRPRLANVGTEVALGNALLACGRGADAVAAYERALTLHPGAFRARANLVEALRQLGRYEEAGRQLAIARTIYPGHPKLREMSDRLDQSKTDAASGN